MKPNSDMPANDPGGHPFAHSESQRRVQNTINQPPMNWNGQFAPIPQPDQTNSSQFQQVDPYHGPQSSGLQATEMFHRQQQYVRTGNAAAAGGMNLQNSDSGGRLAPNEQQFWTSRQVNNPSESGRQVPIDMTNPQHMGSVRGEMWVPSSQAWNQQAATTSKTSSQQPDHSTMPQLIPPGPQSTQQQYPSETGMTERIKFGNSDVNSGLGTSQEIQGNMMASWQVQRRSSLSPVTQPKGSSSSAFSGWVRGASSSQPVEAMGEPASQNQQVADMMSKQDYASYNQSQQYVRNSQVNSSGSVNAPVSKSPNLSHSAAASRSDVPSSGEPTAGASSKSQLGSTSGPTTYGGSPRTYPIAQLFVSAARRLSPKENPLASLRNFTILYSSFWDWSLKAIESIAINLKEISFVVFVELWARLLVVSMKKAAIFLKRFGDEHMVNHHAEISEMKKVKTLPALKDTPFVVRILRGEKFSLTADNLTRKLLTARLTSENDTVILDILQKRVQFDTSYSESLNRSTMRSPAQLVSQVYKATDAKDVGGAVVTPSLALLCGLTPADSRQEYLTEMKIEEPHSQPLALQLLNLYRLPTFAGRSRVTTELEDALGWRCAAEAARRRAALHDRHPVDGRNLPNVLDYMIRPSTIRTDLMGNRRARENVLDLCMPSIDSVNGRFVGVATANNNAIWVWDLLKYQVAQCVEIYKKSIAFPWLCSFAKDRLDAMARNNDFVDTVLSECLSDRGLIELDLGLGDSVNIKEQQFDNINDLFSSKSTVDGTSVENATENLSMESVETFIDRLGLSESFEIWQNQKRINTRLKPGVDAPLCLVGHEMPITSLNFLPSFLNGGTAPLALSSSYDGNLLLWDLEEADVLTTFKGSSAIIDSDVDAYGYLFLSGHQDRAACLWCMDRKTPLRILNRHSGQVEKVKFHPNSLLLATGASDENRIRLWDHRIPDIVGVVNCVRSPRCVEFSHNGRFLAVSGSESAIVNIWDMIAGRLFASITVDPTNEHFPLSLSFSHGSSLLATTDTAGTVQLWDLDAIAASSSSAPPVVGVMDQCDMNSDSLKLDNTNAEYKRHRVAHYSCATSKARLARFSDTNVLLLVNEEITTFCN